MTLPVTVAMASIPEREPILRAAVASVYDQADRVCVYLNGYAEVPDFLRQKKIVVERGDNTYGDAAKFWWADETDGYYFTCDDDIVYPADYVTRMMAALARHQRSVVVGVLGRIFRDPLNTRFHGPEHVRLKTTDALEHDRRVHMLGTGTVAFCAPAIGVNIHDFLSPNMADLWLAHFARDRHMPLMAIARPAGWLRLLPSTGIYERTRTADDPQTRLMRAGAPWPECT